jgi:hypothetical protein
MTPLVPFAAGLQVISSWLMSVLTLLAIVVSVVISIAFVELIFERSTLAKAYTVKMSSSDEDVTPARR